MCFACMYFYEPYVCYAHRGQKRISNPSEVELQTVERYIWVQESNSSLFEEQPELLPVEPSPVTVRNILIKVFHSCNEDS